MLLFVFVKRMMMMWRFVTIVASLWAPLHQSTAQSTARTASKLCITALLKALLS
jgi:hypothetical protein